MTSELPLFLPYNGQTRGFRQLTEICRKRMNRQSLVRKAPRAYQVVSHVPFGGSFENIPLSLAKAKEVIWHADAKSISPLP